ncbi:MAG: acetyl-CoA hydrolase [Gammaproteobacteria bacterium]|nr:acetyl-CoA hydrolase [Gammaproteobacteria bacterium]
MAEVFDSLGACVEAILARLGKRLVIGTPLGIGKPNALLNALYRRARADASIRIELITALSLNPPRGHSELERRFLAPIVERVWGDYPRLEYLDDLQAGRLPDNVRVAEFYFKSGAMLGNSHAQQHYISTNYTEVARDMLGRGVNLLLQAVAMRDGASQRRLSLSSNPDVTLQLMPMMRRLTRPWLAVAQVNRGLPWISGDAEVGADYFHLLLDAPGLDHRPFAVPHTPVSATDYAIGVRAAAAVPDGGTLQVGIGALGDAVCHALRWRAADPAAFAGALEAVGGPWPASLPVNTQGFDQGLYVSSELISYPLFTLFEQGLVRRAVYDDETVQALVDAGLVTPGALRPDLFDAAWRAGLLGDALGADTLRALRRFGLAHPDLSLLRGRLYLQPHFDLSNELGEPAARRTLDQHARGPGLRGGINMHGAFFIGPQVFYQRLSALSAQQRERIGMTSVGEVNRCYARFALNTLQRRDARFINVTMKATLLGAAISDQLAGGQMVSGVGGQFDFVAMAHQLPGARSILMLRATRGSGRKLESNLVWEYPHATIPRHLRDIFVTEYGLADLRGATDAECIAAMIHLAGPRFRRSLAAQACAASKLPRGWQPDTAAAPASHALAPWLGTALPKLPFGSDFTEQELSLADHLRRLKTPSRRLLTGLIAPPRGGAALDFALRHLQLDRPRGLRQRWLARLVRAAYV